jgi:hypothetical protein
MAYLKFTVDKVNGSEDDPEVTFQVKEDGNIIHTETRSCDVGLWVATDDARDACYRWLKEHR